MDINLSCGVGLVMVEALCVLSTSASFPGLNSLHLYHVEIRRQTTLTQFLLGFQGAHSSILAFRWLSNICGISSVKTDFVYLM